MKKILGSILFTDIKGSSKLWSNYPSKMPEKIKLHNKLIKKIVENNSGMVVKFIGDAFMCVFRGSKSYLQAIKTAIDIQTKLRTNPIVVSGSNLIEVRIGIAYGKLNEVKYALQGHKFYDYLGATVNLASRMESEISPVGGFAFTLTEKYDSDKLELYLKKKEDQIEVDAIKFKSRCRSNVIARSARILGLQMTVYCEMMKKLYGATTMNAFRVKVDW
jgi:hypothetical protein